MAQSPTTSTLARPPNTGSTFRQRLFYYSIGLAIGCVMAGSLISARYKAAQANRTPGPAAEAAAPSPPSAHGKMSP